MREIIKMLENAQAFLESGTFYEDATGKVAWYFDGDPDELHADITKVLVRESRKTNGATYLYVTHQDEGISVNTFASKEEAEQAVLNDVDEMRKELGSRIGVEFPSVTYDHQDLIEMARSNEGLKVFVPSIAVYTAYLHELARSSS